jgi:plastocyanin
MRNLTKANRSSVGSVGLCLILATATLGAILTLPAFAADTEVNIDNFAFAPNELTINAGTAIVFRNRDDIPHMVVGTKGEFHSNALDTDDSFSFTFAKAGTYAYFCGLHPQMQGKIIVTP